MGRFGLRVGLWCGFTLYHTIPEPQGGAIRAALTGRFLNVLITDEDTPLALVG